MIARIWRFFACVSDWRNILPRITGKLVIDAVFVSNMRDSVDRKRFLGKWHPPEGHFNGPRYWLNGVVSGRTRVIDNSTDEMRSREGRQKARQQFVEATKWAIAHGAKVILLAAATKRLFDEKGLAVLKEMFPEVIFTIGDNGTFLLLKQETLRALQKAGLKPAFSRIAVLGPYGFLGEMITRTLTALGYQIIGAGLNERGLQDVREKYGIQTCRSFASMGRVDAVVACTHSERIRLTAENVELIRRNNRKLLVVDVAEPSNLRYREYQNCKNVVIRQDAGNAYTPGLKYVLGAISYRMFRLTRGVTFGCFAEALSLAGALKRGEDVKSPDWLIVNEENMEVVANMFAHDGFEIPSARCFGRPIRSFNLEFRTLQNESRGIEYRLGRQVQEGSVAGSQTYKEDMTHSSRKGRSRKTNLIRQLEFLTVSLILRWPIWIVLGALRIFKPFGYIFLVYPGSDSDLDGYCPRRLAKSWLFSKKPTIGGIISNGTHAYGRGLVLVVPNTVREFFKNEAACRKVMKRLQWIKTICGAKAIAIAGQVPGMIQRHNISLEQPFVRGNKGTVFCIMETISEVMTRHRLEIGKFKIVLVGVGYVGNLLMTSLQELGHDVAGVDIKMTRRGITLSEQSRPLLEQADMVIVLTPKGTDFAPYIKDLKIGAIVIDDTHPKILEQPIGVTFYKVAVGIDGVNFLPRLPGYKRDWIPGCAVEAIYSAATGKFNGCSQREFNERAEKLGFFAHLVS